MNTITDANKNFDDVCLHDLFEEQAKKTPDAVALVDYNSSYNGEASNADGTIELTYRQVDTITDALAVKLVEARQRCHALAGCHAVLADDAVP